jgi:outer membrane protein OmpA-like peptidoglycan-associated protein
MKALVLVAAVLAATPVAAEPNQLSQHPRVGELAQINFNDGSTRLSVDYNRKIGEVAGWAQTNPTGLIVISGFASPQETRGAEDVVLSLKRAEAVRDELISQGIDPDRIVIAAFGGRGTPRADVYGTNEPLTATVTSVERRNPATIVWGTRPASAVAGR